MALYDIINRNATLNKDDGCWEWTGIFGPEGRPRWHSKWVKDRVWRYSNPKAKFAYRDYEVMPVCGNPACVHPEHLEPRPVREVFDRMGWTPAGRCWAASDDKRRRKKKKQTKTVRKLRGIDHWRAKLEKSQEWLHKRKKEIPRVAVVKRTNKNAQPEVLVTL